MKHILYVMICFGVLFGCSKTTTLTEAENMIGIDRQVEHKDKPNRNVDLQQFNRTPTEWGENVTGVKTRFQTEEKEIE